MFKKYANLDLWFNNILFVNKVQFWPQMDQKLDKSIVASDQIATVNITATIWSHATIIFLNQIRFVHAIQVKLKTGRL